MRPCFPDATILTGPVGLLRAAAPADLGSFAGAAVVAWLSGLPLCMVSPEIDGDRLAASGDVPSELAAGTVLVWGSGAAAQPNGAQLVVRATRGPFSRAVLGGPDVHGDPAWLLPWFYRPAIHPSWELGLVLSPGQAPPVDMPPWVLIIPGHAASTQGELGQQIDALMSCRRIASATQGGLVLAEAYGIACLPLMATPDGRGLKQLPAAPDSLPFAVADIYAGLRRKFVPAYLHPPDAWPIPERLVAAIDKSWSPAWLREDDLIEAFPLPRMPLARRDDATFPEHQVLTLVPEAALARHLPAIRCETLAAPSLQDWVDSQGAVPLAWAATSEQAPYPNLGDALSAVIVSAMTGLPLQRRNFDDSGERLVAVGTIGHAQRNGIAHLWGTALDARRNAFDAQLGRFAVPPNTQLVVHATRGPNTASRLREAGVACPDVYGDPVSFLPRLFGDRPVKQRWELGVILHITELESASPDASVLAAYRRYEIPPHLAGTVRLIGTYTEQGTEALLAKVDEIRSCRRIVSTSFHGLVIPEAFGIPNMWFSTHAGGPIMADVHDPDMAMDHRVRDWYAGMTRRRIPIFAGQRHLPTRWDQVIRWLDTAWEPAAPNAAALFDAFPLRKAVSLDMVRWPLDPALFENARY